MISHSRSQKLFCNSGLLVQERVRGIIFLLATKEYIKGKLVKGVLDGRLDRDDYRDY